MLDEALEIVTKLWRGDYETRFGFTHICLHDVSEDQARFIEFAKQFVAAG